MARIRTIKPEFWMDEDLSELPEATHMLAAGLLNHADDEGYFQANPGLVKAACSPLREPSVSIHDSLILLQKIGYIRLGTGEDGKRYGRVKKFSEHQRVNRPTQSKIKALRIAWDESGSTHSQLTEDSPPERKGKEGKGKEEKACASSDDDAPTRSEPIPFQHIADAFNRTMGRLPKVREITTKRKTLIRSAWQASPQRRTKDFWDAYFEECADDPFLSGVGPYRNGHENWRPDFDYLLRAEVVTRVFEKAMHRMERQQ